MSKINKFINEESDLNLWGEAKSFIRIILFLIAFWGAFYALGRGLRPDTDEYLEKHPDVIDTRIRELKLLRSQNAYPSPVDDEQNELIEPQSAYDFPDLEPAPLRPRN
ncbi:MAG: hypothetical protein ACE5EN_10980 [Nitrospinota bacterium]